MSQITTPFDFTVDGEYSRKHNEFFRDAKRLQIAAGVLAVLLIAVVILLFVVLGPTVTSFALGITLGFFALLCLIIIPVLPRKMGDPQHYYNMYELAPAVVAKVNPRDMVLLALVDATGDPSKPSRPALAARTVTSIPGTPREVGARVPSMAVTGVQTMRSKGLYEEISPMPVAWGTKDESVWKDAERAIPRNMWAMLEGLMDEVENVTSTKRNLLLLDPEKHGKRSAQQPKSEPKPEAE